MKEKRSIFRWLYYAILAFLSAIYPIYWWIVIATTPKNPDSIDPTGLNLIVAIILAIFWYGALWLATLVYESILFALKKSSKRRFVIALSILFTLLIAVGGGLFINSLLS